MFNGHHTHDTVSSLNSSSENITRSSLYNLVNTCYLNSVLYTLRFTPGFTRKIHHLIADLHQINTVLNQNKHKSSSLGRNIPSLSGAGSRSNSSKDLLSLGSQRNDASKDDFHLIVEELHDLYQSMHKSETRDAAEPLGPINFKLAFVKKYKAFSGTQQQDAHEFLMCLLSAIGDTCQLMTRKKNELRDREINGSIRFNDTNQKEPKSFCARKIRKIISKDLPGPQFNDKVNDSRVDLTRVTSICKFVEDDFEGVSVQRTRCLECENVTERKEMFRDLCIPINDDYDDDDDAVENIFRLACVTSEYLSGSNKYFCETCLHLNIARREVCYQKLPRILIFQTKRFMSSSGTTEKINHFMPTPMAFPCFCEECCTSDKTHDQYTLFSVIMHKGTTMAEGHYVCYVKDLTDLDEYLNCLEDNVLPGGANDSKQTNNRLVELFRTKTTVEQNDTVISKSMNNICRGLQCCSIKYTKSLCGVRKSKDVWLECNDESVRPLTVKELESKLLDRNDVRSTPYLCFYVRNS